MNQDPELLNLKLISSRLTSKIAALNQKLDSRLASSSRITGRDLNSYEGRTIKKQQVMGHSYSPFRETLVTIPKEIDPRVKKLIIQKEKELFIKNSARNVFSGKFTIEGENDVLEHRDFSFRPENYNKKTEEENNFLDNPRNNNGIERKNNQEELISKLDEIKEVLGVDLREHIEKFYAMAVEGRKEKEKKQTRSYRKTPDVQNRSKNPEINVIEVPTIPIEEFMDETEITIKQMKQDVSDELQNLYSKVAKNVA